MALSIQVFVFILHIFFPLSVSASGCFYQNCNPEVPGMINAHLIAHTHDDAGWKSTVDEYYYRQVEFIIDSVVKELEADPTKRFTYVEMAYFTRWWRAQDDAMKETVRKLVDEGRLEFTLGGWVMNDEGTTHYSAIIDQHTLGFDFLRSNFGNCGVPRVGWQVDPFGQSREQASIFAQFGFDGWFFGRLDIHDQDTRKAAKTLEFVWHGSPHNLGSSSDIFTGILPDRYSFPRNVNLDFDVRYIYADPVTQTMIHDDPSLTSYNVEGKVDNFTQKIEDYHSWYATDHVIVTMGGDFNYVDAGLNFKEIDKLIKYTNARQANGSKINVLYSTPACYLKALNDDGRTWTTKSDDFMPYAYQNHTYWSGFYTSRPALKLYSREMNSFLQAAKQLTSLAKLDNSNGDLDNVHQLAAAVALVQHHDAISGTEKQVVAYDYAMRLSEGQAATENTVNSAYAHLMSKNGSEPPVQTFCHYSNVSVCPEIADEDSFEVTMYNPLTWSVTYDAKLPVNGNAYIVYAEDGTTEVTADVIQAPYTADAIRPEGMKPAKFLLSFKASLPPLGFATYFAKRCDVDRVISSKKRDKGSGAFSIEGKYVQVYFSEDGHVDFIENKETGSTTPLTQDFFYYIPFVSQNSSPENQQSGAYVFRPANNTPVPIKLSSFTTNIGSVVQEVRQNYTDWLSQIIRVSYDKPYVEFEWTAGPLPKGESGTELISRYNIDRLNNSGVFYTDSNGRDLMKRVLDYRPTYDADIDEEVAGNYFPVNAHIHVKSGDSSFQVTVLTDRAEGGTSLNDGDIELMLHRRLLNDDHYGVDEALNEPGLDGKGLIVKGSHYLMVDTQQNIAKGYRPAAKEIFLSPKLSFSTSKMEPKEYVSKFISRWSALAKGLPPQVHLLTMEKYRDGGPVTSPPGSVPYLVRFEHFYEKDEDEHLSQPVTFDIQHLFEGLEFVDATELALGGNIATADVKRMTWKYDGANVTARNKSTPALTDTQVTLGPMQIVTLQVNYQA